MILEIILSLHEKEVFKEITGKTSRTRSYFGVFDKYNKEKELKEICL